MINLLSMAFSLVLLLPINCNGTSSSTKPLLNAILKKCTTIIASGMLNKQQKVFENFNQKEPYLRKLYDDFYKQEKPLNPPPAHRKAYAGNQLKNIPSLGGIQPNRSLYGDMLAQPWLYGPWWVEAEILPNSTIRCVLHIWKYSHYSHNRNIYNDIELGEACFNSNHPSVKLFFAEEKQRRCKKKGITVENYTGQDFSALNSIPIDNLPTTEYTDLQELIDQSNSDQYQDMLLASALPMTTCTNCCN